MGIKANTTPDVSHHKQLSICARIIKHNGKCSEHLLSCKRAYGTKAMELYNLISETLASKGVSFDKLVAQTYNGLQAIIKEKVGEHVAFVHCYAHMLHLVLSNSASVAVPVINLFNDLEALYVLFNKTQRMHDLFEAVQRKENLKVLSLKRLNTVRCHSCELCLKVLFSCYDCILSVLDTIALDFSIDGNPRKTSAGLLRQLQTKQVLATAYLFREIFAFTGLLSRYLQRVDVDFGKALGMVKSPIDELNDIARNTADPGWSMRSSCVSEKYTQKFNYIGIINHNNVEFFNALNMASQRGLLRQSKRKCTKGSYVNVYDKVQFNERMHPGQECLPGTFDAECIISSRGTTKVRQIFYSITRFMNL